jgi:hypothetical protein
MSTVLPRMFRVRQHFDGRRVSDPAASVVQELERISLQTRVSPGQSVALAVGSRGIANLPVIVEAVVRFVRAVGGQPFIIPAMGSHGGATAEGQVEVLESLGITPATVGCDIRASMDTTIVGTTSDQFPVHIDSLALEADHLILINRIKPHTRFTGRIQSGLMKMMMIGLGKRNGASLYHRANQTIPFDRLITTVVPILMKARPVTIGLAIVENAHDQTFLIEAVEPDDLLQREPELLQLAQSLMPRLPFDHADLLIVDQIGKDISGTGMDTNIIGRKSSDKAAGEEEYPKLRQIYVRGLTEKTHGNAAGIGLAEYCRSSILDKLDYHSTRLNSVTAGHVTAAAIPVHYPTDLEVLQEAVMQAGLTPPEKVRWMWIRDTLHLTDVLCSEAYYDDAVSRDDLQIVSPLSPLEFLADGQAYEPFAGPALPTAHVLTSNEQVDHP